MKQAASVILTCLFLIHAAGPIPSVLGEVGTAGDLESLRSEIQALQEGQRAIQEDLKALKELLTSRNRPRKTVEEVSLTINIQDAPSKGSQQAKVGLVEFTDYQCPYCARHATSVLPQIEQNFIESGKIQYVLRDFPIASLHPHAGKAHEAAHCAGEQGKYWQMHDQLFFHQKALGPEHLAEYSEKAGVSDRPAFEACLESGRYHQRARENITEGTEAGVRGTPSFLLGLKDREGNVEVVKLIRGAQPYSVFQEQIERLLSSPD